MSYLIRIDNYASVFFVSIPQQRLCSISENKPFFQNLFLPRHSDYTASPQRLEKEKKLTVPKRQTSS